MRFRKKPVEVDASQWFQLGDHPNVGAYPGRHAGQCRHCPCSWKRHGIVMTLESGQGEGHVVCPGDWIITGIKGEHYPCKPDIFTATYEPVEHGAHQ